MIAVRTYRQTLLLAPTSSPSRFPTLQVERVRNWNLGRYVRPGAANLRYMWQRWRAFIHLLAAIAQHRPTVVVLAPVEFQTFARAVSWYVWGGSHLAWASTYQRERGLLQARRGEAGRPRCLMVIDPHLDRQTRLQLQQFPWPTVGYTPVTYVRSLLWATAPEVGGAYETGFACLTALWYLVQWAAAGGYRP